MGVYILIVQAVAGFLEVVYSRLLNEDIADQPRPECRTGARNQSDKMANLPHILFLKIII